MNSGTLYHAAKSTRPRHDETEWQRKAMFALSWAFFTLLTSKVAAGIAICDGNNTITASVCTWHERAAPASDPLLRGAQVAPLPILILSNNAQSSLLRTDFALTLSRLVLANVTLATPGAADVPTLWPLGMFAATGATLNMADVWLLVSDAQLQEHLTYLQNLPDTFTHYHTDGKGWLRIARLNTSSVIAQSVTLLAGPCRLSSMDTYANSSATFAAPFAALPGDCAVRAVDNSSLIPTLLEDAAIDTPQPLLIIITSNVSLGYRLPAGAINIRRPVMMAGFRTCLTSVDFGMVVNQLNATAPLARLYWQSLVLENLAPGNAVTSLIAAPYSGAITSNVWAIYCNRSVHIPCLHLYNTTSVVATQEEMDYVTFMFSMYNSPLSAMRQQTDSYDTELKVTTLQFVPGPGPLELTVLNTSALAWSMVDAIFTPQPVVARKLPVPPGPSLELSLTRAGPLLQAVDSCDTLRAAAQYQTKNNRLHVWLLVSNISIAPSDHPSCWPPQDIKYQTHIFSQPTPQDSSDDLQLIQQALLPGSEVPTSGRGGQSNASERQSTALHLNEASSTPASYLSPDMQFALSFDFKLSAMRLPVDAVEKYMLIQNVTLLHLPQGPEAAAAAGPLVDGKTAADIWTVLIWSIDSGRKHSGSPLFLSSTQLLLPQPEYDYLANEARHASSFAVQLSDDSGLTFSGAIWSEHSVFFTWMQGPGTSGSQITILPDSTAASAMPNYIWPFSVPADPHMGGVGGGTGVGFPGVWAAVGAGIGSGVTLVLLSLWCFWCLRRRQQPQLQHQHQQGIVGKTAALLAGYSTPSKMECGDGVNTSCNTDPSSGNGCRRATQTPMAAASASDASIDVSCSSDQKEKGQGQQQQPQLCTLSEEHLPTRLQQSECSTHSSSVSSASYQPPVVMRGHAAGSSDVVAGDSIASGLDRWRAAISLTTLQMMERRMQVIADSAQANSLRNASSPHQSVHPEQTAEERPRLGSSAGAVAAARPAAAGCGSGDVTPTGAAAGGRGMRLIGSAGNMPGKGTAPQQPGLQLQGLIGQGSCGTVYLGVWHGKQVAVKVMQLPANALLGQQGFSSSSSPRMAIMEAVVSSTVRHPNVVQVYTYVLNPLMVDDDIGSGSRSPGLPPVSAKGSHQPQQNAATGGQRGVGLSGWELRLIMEYCNQGTLRDALDRQTLLPRASSQSSQYLPPALVMNLAQDVSAALLHLHSEGVVHGDLKAANVLLTKGGDDVGGVWAATVGYRVTAKVADFGLALSLDPKDTHVTMAARGTPTHMSPELFLSGHVSKASDVYAFGILLFEVMTGQRAYQGVPIPLLPHEVACQGLRPTWPQDVPTGYKQLQKLAEACWAQKPQDRPCVLDIFEFLMHGKPWTGRRSSGQQLSSSGANVVEQKLQHLQHNADMLAQQVQQQQLDHSPVPQQQLAVVGGAMPGHGWWRMPVVMDLLWSEVTDGATCGNEGGSPIAAAAANGWALIPQMHHKQGHGIS